MSAPLTLAAGRRELHRVTRHHCTRKDTRNPTAAMTSRFLAPRANLGELNGHQPLRDGHPLRRRDRQIEIIGSGDRHRLSGCGPERGRSAAAPPPHRDGVVRQDRRTHLIADVDLAVELDPRRQQDQH
jgi:hypothetical protein